MTSWNNKKVDHEHNHQSAAVTWAKIHTYKYPKLALLYAVPNGGKRNKVVATKLKAEGVKAGQPDLVLPVARRGFHSLYIETKVPKTLVSEKTYPTKLQRTVMKALAVEGNLVVVCWGSIAIQKVLEFYLTEGGFLSNRRHGDIIARRAFAIDYLSKLENVEVINEL